MFQNQLKVPAKYFGNFGYDAAPPMPVIFEKTDPLNINLGRDQSGFQFKYVPEEEFARIIKQVRRNKKKEQEEREWMRFLASQQKKCLCATCPEGLRYQKVAGMSQRVRMQTLGQDEGLQHFIKDHDNYEQLSADKQEDIILESEIQRKQTVFPQQQQNIIKEQENFMQQLANLHQDDLTESEKERRQIVFEELSAALKMDVQKSSQIQSSELEANSSSSINQRLVTNRKSSESQKCQNKAVTSMPMINRKTSPCRSSQNDVPCLNQRSPSRKTSPNRTCQNESAQLACASQTSLSDRNRQTSRERESKDEAIPSTCPSHHSILQDAECVYNKDSCVIPKLNLCVSQREGIHSRRIRSIRQRIDSVFDEILQQVELIPEPDGSQDLMRRRKRAVEFSARFARNYLYHLRHQVCEIQKQIKESLSTCRGRHTLHQSMCQKLVSGHLTALQGLQAYLRHMHSSVRGAASEKMKELFESLMELSVLGGRLGVESTDIDSIERKSHTVLEQISGLRHCGDADAPNSPSAVNVMTTTGQCDWENSLREPARSVSTARASSLDNKNARWQDKAAKLARAAYGSPCRKRHLGPCKNRKRLPASKVIKKVDQPSPLKSGSALKMPDTNKSRLDLAGLSSKLVQICEEKMQDVISSFAKQEWENKQRQLAEKPSREDLQTAIRQIQDITSRTLLQAMSEDSLEAVPKKPTLTERKNVQLICLQQESEEEKSDEAEANDKEEPARHPRNKSEPNLHQRNWMQSQQNTKPLPTALTVSKKIIRSAMDSRQRFQNYVKTNPMYKGGTQPWNMVGRLADHLTEQLLQEMTQEAKLDALINDIYSLEFGGKCLVK